jgi:serine/threonine-protein kinase
LELALTGKLQNHFIFFSHQNPMYMKTLLPIGMLALMMLNILSCKKENPSASDNLTPAKIALDELAQKKPEHEHKPPHVSADYGLVTTFTGSGIRGDLNGAPAVARFEQVMAMASDASDNLYVSEILYDTPNYNVVAGSKIKKISPTGVVSDFAGSATQMGNTNGPGNAATFGFVLDMEFGPDGNLYVISSNMIRKITPDGVVSTIAGTGELGDNDGPAATATFSAPLSIAVNKHGWIYVSEGGSRPKIRVIRDGVVSTISDADIGYMDGPLASARFTSILGMVFDQADNLYISDADNHRIRQISPSGIVSTVAGNGEYAAVDGPGASASFLTPRYIVIDFHKNLYVSDASEGRIRRITPSGVVSAVAGQYRTLGYVNGIGSAALFAFPAGITINNQDNLFVADQNNQVIREIVIK